MQPDISFACPDWWERLQSGRSPMSAQVLDEELAAIAVSLFDKLRIPDIPGQPTFGEAGGDWVREIVRVAFGSVDRVTKQRLVGEIFNLIPKKNGKTTNAAAIGLVAMQMNTTPNIDGVVIGPTQEVADKCFSQMAAMIAADEWLTKRFHVVTHKKTIIDRFPDPVTGRPLNAKLKVKSFDPSVVTGGIPAFAILDELHVMAEKGYADRVIGQIRGGMITNPMSLLIFITTQSERMPVGVFKGELEYARKVRDGLITDHVRMMPILYEFPETLQSDKDRPWKNPAVWPFVLPNIGRSAHLDRLISDYEKAVQTSPEELARWASQHLNIQIGTGMHLSQWTGGLFWGKSTDAELDLAEIKRRCEVCVVGIDGGGMDDLLGLTVIGRDKVTKDWLTWSKAWVHQVGFDRRQSIQSQLRDFEKAGELVICSPEEVDRDVDEVVEICVELNDAGLLPKKAAIGLDPEGVAAIVDALEFGGLEYDQLAPVSQGYKLNSAIKGTERKLFNGSMHHASQALMEWCVGNAKTEPRGNAVVVTKAVSGAGKIDPLMALFNGVMLMSMNPEAPSGNNIAEFLANPVMVI